MVVLVLGYALVQCGGALRSRTRFLFTVLGVSPKPFSLLSFQLPLPYANVYTVYLDKLIRKMSIKMCQALWNFAIFIHLGKLLGYTQLFQEATINGV